MFLFVDQATLNRCSPNGFMPNQVGEIAVAADTITPSESFVSAVRMLFGDTITASDSANRLSKIAVADTVSTTDWVREKK